MKKSDLSDMPVFEAALTSLGYACLSAKYIERDLQEKSLVRALQASVLPLDAYYSCNPNKKHLSRAFRGFVSTVQANLKSSDTLKIEG